MDIKFYTLISGYQIIEKQKLLLSAKIGEKVEIPVPYFLVDYGQEKILIDTGISNKPNESGSLANTSSISEDDHPVKALNKIGITPEEITYVIHTHLHFDHAANTKYFSNAEVIVQLSELRAAYFDDPIIKHGYVENDIKQPQINWQPIVGMKSLFDEKLLIFPTPGHTPGHQSVLLRLKNYGNIIIAGDCAPLEDNITKDTPPGVASNTEEAFYSIKSLKELARYEKAQIWYGHESEFFKTIRLFPNYYD